MDVKLRSGTISWFPESETYAINASLTIATSSLPSGVVGSAYSQTLTAMGGVPPYIWTITSGSLPDGLTINSFSGVISGTAIAEGTFSFAVQVTDTDTSTATKNLSITMNPSNNLPVKMSGYYYSSVQEAYDTCSDDDIVEMQIQDADIYEDLFFDRDVTVTMKGGYNSDFTDNSSYTRIHGKVTIINGSVLTDSIIIQ